MSTLAALRRRWYLFVGLLVFAGVCWWLVHGANEQARERRASRDRIEASANEAKDLAQQVKDQNDSIQRILMAIDSATSPEARKTQADTLAYAIGDLRRSIDCVAFYAAGQRPPACADVDTRMDAILAGADPFPKPPAPQTQTTSPGGTSP